MFLGKYKNKRKLGHGAFGDVYLVEDQQGVEYALKLIATQKIRNQPYLKQYLRGQIKCMKSMNCPNIIRLYDINEDPNYIYLVLEYCDGGDLIHYQGNLKDKVFTLKQATKVLADVIVGLQDLHKAGYLHRDIKSQNILLKRQNGKQVFKLADFGFSKKSDDICKTVLGTNDFMSPEILSVKPYGYEVDMWAFGVVLYFMLNQELPFKLNTYAEAATNRLLLIQQAQNFSYQKSVKKSRKKLLDNCTPELEDLFKRIFDLDPKRRITFAQIREHPVFAAHFPLIDNSSKILYEQNFTVMNISENNTEEESIPVSFSRIKVNNKQFLEERNLLKRKKDEIDFLKGNVEIFLDCGSVLQNYQKMMLAYNLQKYYIILLRDFKNVLNVDKLTERYPNMKWSQYLKTKDFRQIFKEVDEDLNDCEMKFSSFFDQCQNFEQQIKKINDRFQAAFTSNVQQTSFDGAFKKSYRKSTSYIYAVLNILVRKGNNLKQQIYLLTMVLISHSFNNIFDNTENVAKIFGQYIAEKKIKANQIDYSDLREWVSRCSRESLKRIGFEISRQFNA